MKPMQFTYAGRLERLFANLLDALILLVPTGILASAFEHKGLALLVAFLCNVAYYTAFVSSGWQASPGKRIMGMFVIHADGSPLSQRDALERFLAYVLPSLPIYTSFLPENVSPVLVVWLSIAWFSPILFTPERVGLHDRMCNTRVIVGRRG